jgi:hypothetical protein
MRGIKGTVIFVQNHMVWVLLALYQYWYMSLDNWVFAGLCGLFLIEGLVNFGRGIRYGVSMVRESVHKAVDELIHEISKE